MEDGNVVVDEVAVPAPGMAEQMSGDRTMEQTDNSPPPLLNQQSLEAPLIEGLKLLGLVHHLLKRFLDGIAGL